jgi:uncharacterized membrane protein
MNSAAFLRILRDGLAGLPPQDIDDILADYAVWFDEGRASGRSEEDVAAGLGDPRRLARELRAESGLRRWENHHSMRNSAAALLALGGLAAVDVLLLLPLLFAVMLIVLVACLVSFVLGIIGIAALLSIFKIAEIAPVTTILLRAITGIGLIAAGATVGALPLLALNGAVRKLGEYARLHYRLLKTDSTARARADLGN